MGRSARESSMRETGTPFLGKFSVAKSLVGVCAAFVFASGYLVLLPTQASAQLNIDGLIRGAIRAPGYGYGYRGPSHHSSSSHSSSHHDDSDDDSAADSKNDKGIKSRNGR